MHTMRTARERVRQQGQKPHVFIAWYASADPIKYIDSQSATRHEASRWIVVPTEAAVVQQVFAEYTKGA